MNRKKNKAQRRVRPMYPELKPGQSALVRRLECGERDNADTKLNPGVDVAKSYVFMRAPVA
jgi:hypothetical protein